jgi:hypothetical protein
VQTGERAAFVFTFNRSQEDVPVVLGSGELILSSHVHDRADGSVVFEPSGVVIQRTDDLTGSQGKEAVD